MELNLDGPINHRSLKILFDAGYGKQDQFCLEVWQIKTLDDNPDSGSAATRIGPPGSVCAEGGVATLEINPASMDEISSLGIVVTRLDAHERSDPGNYSLRILRK
jgi:hypothetical protein